MSEKQFATFYLGDALFGIDIILVREINRQLEMTPVHMVDENIRGLLNLRGQIVTVLDLAIKMGLPSTEIMDTSRTLILKTQEELKRAKTDETFSGTGEDITGLLVDRVGDVVTIDISQLEASPANMQRVHEQYIQGVVKLDNELLTILNVSKVLEE